MSAALNEVNLLGNLGADADYNFYEKTGTHMTVLSLCTEDVIVLRSGQTKKDKDWHRIVLWGDNAIEAKLLKKGDQLYVSGKLKYGRYKNTQGIECFRTDIVAHTCIKTEENMEQNPDDGKANGGFGEDPLKPNNPSRSITYGVN